MEKIAQISLGASLLVSFVALIAADVSHLPAAQPAAAAPIAPSDLRVTDKCLGCICEMSSDCQRDIKCENDVCGLFRITWAYWVDAGRFTVNNEAKDSKTAYTNCALDPYCAALSVQGYMAKFAQDCDGDGQINCYDYAQIHFRGGYSCQQKLGPVHQYKLEQCLKLVAGA